MLVQNFLKQQFKALTHVLPVANIRKLIAPQHRVRIEGDAETAQAFRELLSHAHPDLEAEVARHMGEGPAHHALRLARGVFNFGTAGGAADTVESLRAWTPPWVIGLPAQVAAVQALLALMNQLDERSSVQSRQ